MRFFHLCVSLLHCTAEKPNFPLMLVKIQCRKNTLQSSSGLFTALFTNNSRPIKKTEQFWKRLLHPISITKKFRAFLAVFCPKMSKKFPFSAPSAKPGGPGRRREGGLLGGVYFIFVHNPPRTSRGEGPHPPPKLPMKKSQNYMS